MPDARRKRRRNRARRYRKMLAVRRWDIEASTRERMLADNPQWKGITVRYWYGKQSAQFTL